LCNNKGSGIIFETYPTYESACKMCYTFASIYSDKQPVETFQVHDLSVKHYPVVYFVKTDQYLKDLETKIKLENEKHNADLLLQKINQNNNTSPVAKSNDAYLQYTKPNNSSNRNLNQFHHTLDVSNNQSLLAASMTSAAFHSNNDDFKFDDSINNNNNNEETNEDEDKDKDEDEEKEDRLLMDGDKVTDAGLTDEKKYLTSLKHTKHLQENSNDSHYTSPSLQFQQYYGIPQSETAKINNDELNNNVTDDDNNADDIYGTPDVNKKITYCLKKKKE